VTNVRNEALAALNLTDVWQRLEIAPGPSDPQGWNSDHPFLQETIARYPSPCVVEVGVWKGASVLTMARTLRDSWNDGVVIAVDTFLGSAEHYFNLDYRVSLGLKNGYPTLFHTFLRNLVAESALDFVIPLPLDSTNASHLLAEASIRPQVIHIDAGHDYESVTTDLRLWFDLLEPGGTVICDDYVASWSGVMRAVDEFLLTHKLDNVEVLSGKIRFTKPTDWSESVGNRAEVDADIASRYVELERRHSAVTSSRIWRWTSWLHG